MQCDKKIPFIKDACKNTHQVKPPQELAITPEFIGL